MGATPNYALPYPEPTDPADVTTDMKELAERIELAIGNAFDARLDALEASLGVEAWHEIGAGGQPPFQNSWTNFSGTDETAAFRMEPNKVVRCKGVVKGGSASAAIFTLPAGYRPAKVIRLEVSSGAAGTADRIEISAAGVVTVPTGTVSYVDLTGVEFVANP
jgi:hypothetical protein